MNTFSSDNLFDKEIVQLKKTWNQEERVLKEYSLDKPKHLLESKDDLQLIAKGLLCSSDSLYLHVNIHQRTVGALTHVLRTSGCQKEQIDHYENILSCESLTLSPHDLSRHFTLLAHHSAEGLKEIDWCDAKWWQFPVSIDTNQTVSFVPQLMAKDLARYSKAKTHKSASFHRKGRRKQKLVEQVTFDSIRLNQAIINCDSCSDSKEINSLNLPLKLLPYISQSQKQYAYLNDLCDEIVPFYISSESGERSTISSLRTLSVKMQLHVLDCKINVLNSQVEELKRLHQHFKLWADASVNRLTDMALTEVNIGRVVNHDDRQELLAALNQHGLTILTKIEATKAALTELQTVTSQLDNQQKGEKTKKRSFRRYLHQGLMRLSLKRKKQKKNDIQRPDQREGKTLSKKIVASSLRLNHLIEKIEDYHTVSFNYISSQRFITEKITLQSDPNEVVTTSPEELRQTYHHKSAQLFNDFVSGSAISGSQLENLCGQVRVLSEKDRQLYWLSNAEPHQQLLDQFKHVIAHRDSEEQAFPESQSRYKYLQQVIKYFLSLKSEGDLNKLRTMIDQIIFNHVSCSSDYQAFLKHLRKALGYSNQALKEALVKSHNVLKSEILKANNELKANTHNVSSISLNKIKQLIQLIQEKEFKNVEEAKSMIVSWKTIVEPELDRHQQLSRVIQLIEHLIVYEQVKKRIVKAQRELALTTNRNPNQAVNLVKVKQHLKLVAQQNDVVTMNNSSVIIRRRKNHV